MDHLVRHSLIVPTKLGPFRVQCSCRGISRIDFPSGCSGGLRPPKSLAPPPTFIRTFARQLQQYAAGKRVRWTVPLDLSAGTAFQQAVWRALKTIPRGQAQSYGWVAQKIGRPKASHAVGAACGANPVPVVVPCHRVIASGGSIGGFGAGLPMKRRLLRIEGVKL